MLKHKHVFAIPTCKREDKSVKVDAASKGFHKYGPVHIWCHIDDIYEVARVNCGKSVDRVIPHREASITNIRKRMDKFYKKNYFDYAKHQIDDDFRHFVRRKFNSGSYCTSMKNIDEIVEYMDSLVTESLKSNVKAMCGVAHSFRYTDSRHYHNLPISKNVIIRGWICILPNCDIELFVEDRNLHSLEEAFALHSALQQVGGSLNVSLRDNYVRFEGHARDQSIPTSKRLYAEHKLIKTAGPEFIHKHLKGLYNRLRNEMIYDAAHLKGYLDAD